MLLLNKTHLSPGLITENTILSINFVFLTNKYRSIHHTLNLQQQQQQKSNKIRVVTGLLILSSGNKKLVGFVCVINFPLVIKMI